MCRFPNDTAGIRVFGSFVYRATFHNDHFCCPHFLVKMSVICNLPDDLVVLVMCDFMDTKDLAIFDKALCSFYHRPNFLKIIQYPYFITQGFPYEYVRLEELYFIWLNLRKCQVASLKYGAKWNNSLSLDDYICTTKIVDLAVSGGTLTAKDIADVVDVCQNVRILQIFKNVDDSVIAAIANNCKYITDLHLPFSSAIENTDAF